MLLLSHHFACGELIFELFLYPLADQKAVVAGKVIIQLPKAAEIRGIAVRVTGKAHVRTLDRESFGTTIELRSDLLVSPKSFGPGLHEFDFLFSIPSRTSTHFRVSFEQGSIKHHVVATVDGLGFRGGSLTAEDSVSFLPVLVEAGEPPAGLELYVEDSPAYLGPLSLHIQSPQFTVGSLFLTSFQMVAATKEVTLVEASLILREKVTARHYSLDGKAETIEEVHPPYEMRLFRLDSTHPPSEGGSIPRTLQAGEGWKMEHFARLPDGDHCRFSSARQTVTPLRVTHDLCFKLNFKIADDQHIRQMQIERPLIIASCLTIFANLIPPDYSAHFEDPKELSEEQKPRAFDQTKWGSRPHEKCICRLTYQQCLADWHAQMPSRVDEETKPSYKVDPI